MRKSVVSRGMLTLFLVAMLLFVSIVEAISWSSPSYVTEPNISESILFHSLSISGDGSKIAFATCSVNDVSRIFVVNSDGSGLKQLTNDSEGVGLGVGCPSISGDGTKIAFTKCVSGRDPDETLAEEIFVINSDGSERIQLTNNSIGPEPVLSERPCISGDGSKIVFPRIDFNTWNSGIYVINSDGTEEKQLTTTPPSKSRLLVMTEAKLLSWEPMTLTSRFL